MVVVPRHRSRGEVSHKKNGFFLRFQVEKKEENPSYTGCELHSRMWWAKQEWLLQMLCDFSLHSNSHPPLTSCGKSLEQRSASEVRPAEIQLI